MVCALRFGARFSFGAEPPHPPPPWNLPVRVTVREEKNSININFLTRISHGHSWPLRPDAQGSKSFSPPPGPQENELFGADVHDFRRGRPWPEGLSKNFVQKKFCVDFLAPIQEEAQPSSREAQVAREVLRSDLLMPCTHFEMPSEDLFWAGKPNYIPFRDTCRNPRFWN